ncbi:hypothetical protein P8X34_05540 [Pyrococcus kukulkanii]|uniref:PIN domain-containing protein n=3 Tax=Pyrococcus kukulkanii TaxID=1609559 RepID=A0ABV4T352_9EURY
MSTLKSTGTFLDSSVIMNLLFETELTQKAQKLFSLAENPVVSETVIDECIYTTL